MSKTWKCVRVKGAPKSLREVMAMRVEKLEDVPFRVRERGRVWSNRADGFLYVASSDSGATYEEALPCYLVVIGEMEGVFTMERSKFEEHFELVGEGS